MPKSQSVNYELVQIALERVSGSVFERFINGFYPSIAGENFIPLGGNKDGGADAFQTDRIWEGEKTGTFYQSSIEPNYRSKIGRTIKRLREFGRIVKRLIYVTSQPIQHIDVEEAELSKEHDVDIRLRDKSYIISHINDTVGTRESYVTYLEPSLAFLKRIGSSNSLPTSKHVTSPAIYVFLRQELERQEGREQLVNALTDGLILWALEGTDPDPDKEFLMSEAQIIEKIKSAVPASVNMIKGAIRHRLAKLSKGVTRDRAIRYYKKRDLYCLAYEFRQVVEKDNASDELVRIAVRDIFTKKIQGYKFLNLSGDQIQQATDISFTVIQKIFENQGLEFAAFLEHGEQQHNLPTISDYIDSCLEEIAIKADQRIKIKEAIISNLQSAFYASEQAERLFFSRLSATYTLLFCLNTEPRIVEYFQNMKADFYLYVGADLLVRALSERYLRPEDQTTRNALKIIQEAGGKLVIAEPVLDEVHGNIQVANNEFYHFYQNIESSVNLDVARNADKILIRAYFYAKLKSPVGITPPQSWTQFINQFCSPSSLGSPKGREEIKHYLVSQYNAKFEEKSELLNVTNAKAVKDLAEKLRAQKKFAKLAENDALIALAVYGRRRKRKETSKVSEYGYRTWWLTGEAAILSHTEDLIEREGAKYIMRPEFLLNFMALAPSVAEVRESYRTIFPSILGIRLARRVDPRELHKVLKKLDEAQGLETGRRQAKIAELSDELKSLPSIKPGAGKATTAKHNDHKQKSAKGDTTQSNRLGKIRIKR